MNASPTIPPLKGQVPTSYARLLCDYLQQRQLDSGAVFAELQPISAAERYPIADWKLALERAAALLNDPLLGLKLGSAIDAKHFGVFGYVLLNCGTLGAALQRLQRYEQMIYQGSAMQVDIEADRICLSWGAEQGRPGPLVDETAIAALIQFCRNITGVPDAAPLAVDFINPFPIELAPYEAWFGCPVSFEKQRTQVSFPLAGLQQPLRQADPALITLLEKQAEQLLHANTATATEPWLSALKNQLANALRDGTPTLQWAAEKMHSSPRSLHRRLAAQSYNFRQLLDEVRATLAKDYLANPSLTLSDIALLLGYSEQSAFNRGFKRSTGVTPLQYRKALKQSEIQLT